MKKIMNMCKERNKRIILVNMGIFLYFAFLICKFFGLFDFTNKFGIEKIYANELYSNQHVMMIDEDNLTTWGIYETHHPGESIVFCFRSTRPFSEIRVENYSEESTIPLLVFSSQNGIDWEEKKGSLVNKEHEDIIVFNEAFFSQYIKFEYTNMNEGFWPISEVHFNE